MYKETRRDDMIVMPSQTPSWVMLQLSQQPSISTLMLYILLQPIPFPNVQILRTERNYIFVFDSTRQYWTSIMLIFKPGTVEKKSSTIGSQEVM